MNRANLKSFIHGSAASMIGVGTLGIMNYFIRRTLALNLSETDYGFFYSAFALVVVIMVFFDLGLSQATIILLSKSFSENNLHKARNIFTHAFIIKIFLALVFFLIMEALAPYLMCYYFKYPGKTLFLMLIFLLIPAQALESSLSCVITAHKKFTTYNILLSIKTFVVLVGVFFYSKTHGIEHCIICFIVASLIVSILSFIVVKRYGITLLPLKAVKFDELRNIFSISSWIVVSTAAISVMYSMDTICLTWLENLKSVAMYQIALPIMQIAQGFFVFPSIFIPFVAEMWQKKKYAEIKRSCYLANLLMLSTLPIFILAGIYFASDIIALLFDEKYIVAAPAVTILWSGMVFFSIASFNIAALNSGGRQKSAAYMVLACVVINFILNIVLIPRFNFTGAALSTAITYLIMALASIIALLLIFNKNR